jgi:hypothetical protein
LKANPFLTTLRLKEKLGSATITHPFHPLSGKNIQILKTRKIGGRIVLTLRNEHVGNINVPADWTDYFSTDQNTYGTPDVLISVESLLALCELMKKTDTSCT